MAASITVPEMGKFIKAIAQVPNVQLRYMRTELNRGLKRMRKNFIAAQLQGPPGITAGTLARGKNVTTFVSGENLAQLGGSIRISRILHVHEKGLTIKAKKFGALFLHEKGRGPVVAKVSQVVIPARLRFRHQVIAETPAMLLKVGKAATRATEETLRKGLS